MLKRVIFRQLLDYESFTYTYILGCTKTRNAVIIDPVDITVARDYKLIRDLDLNLQYAINTHVHADHITGSGILKALIPTCQSAISKDGGGVADIKLEDGQILKFGEQEIECRSTPGHTDGCMTFVNFQNEMVFTGDALLIRACGRTDFQQDALLIRACGRTDFQQGDSNKLYDAVHSKIFALPPHFMIYPGHDYKGMCCTSVEEEMNFNPRLTKSKEEFGKIMDHLGLDPPNKIDTAVPANLLDGSDQVNESLVSQIMNAV